MDLKKITPVTAEDIRSMVASQMEPTEPYESIANFLAENKGKRWDRHLASKMEAAIPTMKGILIGRRTSDSDVVTITWRNTETGVDSMSLTVARSVKNMNDLRVDVDAFKAENASEYKGASDRNKRRLAFLGDIARQQKLADAINAYNNAFKGLADVMGQATPGDDPTGLPDYWEFFERFIVKGDDIKHSLR